MDAFSSDPHHLFSLPVALIFQNESGSGIEEQSNYGYNTTTTVNVSQSSHNWKKEEVVLSGLQKLEKVGDAIRRELKWALILHSYGFGCIFFILAFYTFFSILNIRSFISNRPFMSTINGFLCLLGTTRAVSLLINPYNLKENMPKLFGQVLWDLGFPSIISAFCLVQLAFHQFTQLRVGPESLRRKSCLSLIVTAHFLLTIGTDIVVASHENLMIVKHVVHYVFLTWGVYLCSNFLYTGYKVMSLLRKMPGGFKHRELSDPSYKGIMQLAILPPPHSNLAGSMTTALLPTLCAPKIHQQDSSNLSAIGFGNDSNPRILESESIPMLEEMAGSSGDEISPKPLARGSSFQHQARNSQKINLRPRLSLRNVSDDSKNEESGQKIYSGPKSPKSTKSKSQSPKTLLVKANEFNFNEKLSNGILKHTENFVTTKNFLEFKNKTQQKTSFENESFRFFEKNKLKGNILSSPVPEASSVNNLIPEILVSGSHNPENDEVIKAKRKGSNLVRNDKNKKILKKLMNEISKDLNEMQILREEEIKSEEVVEVCESKRNECENELVNDTQSKVEVDGKCSDCKKKNRLFEKEYEKINCGEKCEHFTFKKTTTTKEISAFTEITKHEEPKVTQQKNKGRRKKKSLTWKKKTEDEDKGKATPECLLLQDNSTDVSLRSVLNHMSCMNRGTSNKINSEHDLEKIRKSKIEWVLNITYITAMWGLMLCLSNMGKIYSLFGMPESRKYITFLNSTYSQGKAPTESIEGGILYSSWPWLWFQTFCRALELAMGCAMANITRQPTANHRLDNIRHIGSDYVRSAMLIIPAKPTSRNLLDAHVDRNYIVRFSLRAALYKVSELTLKNWDSYRTFFPTYLATSKVLECSRAFS